MASNSMIAGEPGAAGLPAHRTGLRPVRDSETLGGFGNLFRKELREWFGTKRWLVHAVIWLAIVNGLTAFVLFVVPLFPTPEGEQPDMGNPLTLGLSLVLSMIFEAGAIGAIISALDEIVGEKQKGTAGWILSKPVTRLAFVLTKLLATTIGIVTFVAALTGAVGYVEISLAVGNAIPVWPFLGALGLVTLGLIYFVALAIMLGTLFNERGPVIGISLGLLLGGMMFVQLLPQLALVAPFNIHQIAAALAGGTRLPADWPISLAATVTGILAFSVIACWRFQREEL